MKGTNIETLKKMTIGEIKQLEQSWNRKGDVIDQKNNFLEYLNNGN